MRPSTRSRVIVSCRPSSSRAWWSYRYRQCAAPGLAPARSGWCLKMRSSRRRGCRPLWRQRVLHASSQALPWLGSKRARTPKVPLRMLKGGTRLGRFRKSGIAWLPHSQCHPEPQAKDLTLATHSVSTVRVRSFGEVLRLRLRTTLLRPNSAANTSHRNTLWEERPVHALYHRIVQPGWSRSCVCATNAGRIQPASQLSARLVLVSQPRHDRVDVCVAETGFVEGRHLLLGPCP